MIICCEKCDTKYRLDASMVSTAAVKVQCSKCAHIFIVPSVKENHGTQDLKVDEPGAAPSPPAPGHEDFELSRHKGAEAGAEAGATQEETSKSETVAETTPSHGFDIKFGASQNGPLTENKTGEDVDENNSPVEPKSEFEVESYIAGSNAPLGQAEKEEQDVGEEVKATEAETSRDFDLTFGSPDEALGGDAGAGPEDEKATDEAEVKAKRTEAKDTSEPQDSAENKEVDSTGEISAHTFEATFNRPDEAPTGDGEVSREFIKPDAATGETPEPMAKYYIETPSPKSSEGLDLREAPARTEEEQDITTAMPEPEEDTSFVDELLKAEAEAETEQASDDKETPRIESSFVNTKTPGEKGAKKSGMAKAVAIIVIILMLAAGVIYMKSRPQSPLMALPSAERTIEIESVKGYYVLNKDSGRIFVIESMIKNITDGPVKISGIRGLVLDSSGNEMESKMVSPGRVVGARDLRTLPVDRLLRSFRDTSESTIPKKAVIPTMILFPDLNDAVAEYGIDVLR